MKKLIFSVICYLIVSNATSQVYTVCIDTLRYFQHPSDISTPTANSTGTITLLKTYTFPNRKIIVFDLNRRVQIFEGTESPITVVHDTDNLLDIEVLDNGARKLVFLGKDVSGGNTYLEEYFQDGLTKGFFSLNPEIILED